MSPDDQELVEFLDSITLEGQENWKERPELGLDPDDDDVDDEDEDDDDLDEEDEDDEEAEEADSDIIE